MVQFSMGGPNLPSELLQAYSEGQVVFFVGSGVSCHLAELPNFRALTEVVAKALNTSFTPEETRVLQDNRYDQLFTLLEKRFGKDTVRFQVHCALSKKTKKKQLDYHKALLQLAKSAGQLRIVTTNLDRLFDLAGPKRSSPTPYVAPALPVPKPDRWPEGIVYLHSRIPQDYSRPSELHNLVLSSKDFGRAYLIEGWARRFVLELFRHFTVVFLGYSVSDPVMRYLIDGLDAELENDYSRRNTTKAHSFHPAFVFAPEDEEAQWSNSRSIRPVPFTDYDRLYESISIWSKRAALGLFGKKEQLSKLIQRSPLSLNEAERSELSWLLHDELGAKWFAQATYLDAQGNEKPPSAEWIDILKTLGLLSSFAKGNEPLSNRDWHFAHWLQAHLSTVELISWAVEQSQRNLHMHIKQLWLEEVTRRDQAQQFIHNDKVRGFWETFFYTKIIVDQRDSAFVFIHLRKGEWTPPLRADLLRMLRPNPIIRKRLFQTSNPDSNDPTDGLELELKLPDLVEHSLLELNESVLREIVFEVTEIVASSLRTAEHFPSPKHHSWFPDAPYNHGIGLLVQLLWTGLTALQNVSQNAEKSALLSRWRTLRRFSVFDKLCQRAEGKEFPLPRREVSYGLPSDYTVEELQKLPLDELVQLLNTHPERSGLLNNWSRLSEKDPVRAIRALRQMERTSEFTSDVWMHCLLGLASGSHAARVRSEILRLSKAFSETTQQLPHELGDVLERLLEFHDKAERLTSGQWGDLLHFWDVLPRTEQSENWGTDAVEVAINNPIGRLANQAIMLWRLGAKSAIGDLDRQMKHRLQKLLEVNHADDARAAQVLIAANLGWLWHRDREWTQATVLPWFEWAQDTERASHVWQGFLWITYGEPDMWMALKRDFLEAFNHLSSLNQWGARLYGLLADAALEFPGYLTAEEYQGCLKTLDDTGRANILWHLTRRLSNTVEEDGQSDVSIIDELWRQIYDWIANSWPRELSCKGNETTKRMVQLAVVLDRKFPEAIQRLEIYLQPVNSGWISYKDLHACKLSKLYPKETFNICHIATPSNLNYVPAQDLKLILADIKQAEPPLVNDQRYQRLLEIVERANG